MSTDYIWYTRGGDKRVTERCALLLYLRTTVRHQRAMVHFSVANEKQIIIILFFEMFIFHFFSDFWHRRADASIFFIFDDENTYVYRPQHIWYTLVCFCSC